MFSSTKGLRRSVSERGCADVAVVTTAQGPSVHTSAFVNGSVQATTTRQQVPPGIGGTLCSVEHSERVTAAATPSPEHYSYFWRQMVASYAVDADRE